MKKRLLLLAYLGQVVLALSDNIRGPVLPDLIQQFQLSQSTASLFFAVGSITSFIFGFATQFALKHWGVRYSLQLSLLAMAISQVGIAVAPHFAFILVSIFFLGIALAGIGVIENVLVLSASPPHEAQRWQAILHAIYGGGSILSPLIVTWMLKFGFDWRGGFWITALVAVLVLGMTWKDFSLTPVTPEQGHVLPSKREEIYFAWILAVYVMIEILVSSRIASYMRVEKMSTVELANDLNAWFFIFLLAGRFLFIFWQPQTSIRTQMVTCMLGTGVLITAGILWHPWALALSGLAMAPFYPLAMTALGRLFPHNLGSAASYCVALSGITVVSMHLLVGYISDTQSISAALWLGPLGTLLAILLMGFYRPLFRRPLP